MSIQKTRYIGLDGATVDNPAFGDPAPGALSARLYPLRDSGFKKLGCLSLPAIAAKISGLLVHFLSYGG